MTKLEWNIVGERYYEAGLDRGVLFLSDGMGVPWNGLISVRESPSGGEPKPYYLDGIKYLNVAASEEFNATIDAFSSPSEFGPYEGAGSIGNGLFITQQPRKSFGLAYRTKLGNDVNASDHSYKLHIVYNALAEPSQRRNKTLGGSAEPITLSWAISTTPVVMGTHKPSGHLVINALEAGETRMDELEDILYGTVSSNSRLPSPSEMISIFGV